MKKYIDIVEDIKIALTTISSSAHKGLQSIKKKKVTVWKRTIMDN